MVLAYPGYEADIIHTFTCFKCKMKSVQLTVFSATNHCGDDCTTNVALEMKQRQVELTKVEDELKKRNQEILDLQLRLHEAEKTLVR